jgi:hypothetical protein
MNKDRRKHKRFARPESLTVFDCSIMQPLGELVNLSTDGAMLITSDPIKPASAFRCRMELRPHIMERSEVHFELECRWCRKNVTKSRWESGYRLTAFGDNVYILSFLVLAFKLCGWGDPSIPDAKTIDMPNRRKADRFEFTDRLPIYEHRGYREIGALVDLSVNGVRIISERPISKDDVLKCRLQLPQTVLQVEFLTLTLQCIWCRSKESADQFESGHKFIGASKQDTAVLLHLMINHGNPKQGEKKILVVG